MTLIIIKSIFQVEDCCLFPLIRFFLSSRKLIEGKKSREEEKEEERVVKRLTIQKSFEAKKKEVKTLLIKVNEFITVIQLIDCIYQK